MNSAILRIALIVCMLSSVYIPAFGQLTETDITNPCHQLLTRINQPRTEHGLKSMETDLIPDKTAKLLTMFMVKNDLSHIVVILLEHWINGITNHNLHHAQGLSCQFNDCISAFLLLNHLHYHIGAVSTKFTSLTCVAAGQCFLFGWSRKRFSVLLPKCQGLQPVAINSYVQYC